MQLAIDPQHLPALLLTAAAFRPEVAFLKTITGAPWPPARTFRLPQHIKHVTLELGQFVQEQHAVKRQANLAGARQTLAPHWG